MKFQKSVCYFLLLITLSIISIGCSKQDGKKTMDEKNQQIVDNTLFLNSAEGIEYQAKAWSFGKAFLNGNIEYIKKNSIKNIKLENYGYKDRFSKIKYMIYKINKYDKEKKTVYGEYIINENDSCKYLEFHMVLDKNKWKISSYSIDV